MNALIAARHIASGHDTHPPAPAQQAHRAAQERPLSLPSHQPSTGIDIRIEGVGKSFGTRQVLEGIDLEIGRGEFISVVGRSGCGKSTLLRLLAGLELPTTGQLVLDGRPLRAENVAAQGVRIMFQDARLLPWRTVADNVALGLAEPDVKDRVPDALASVGLADRHDDWPSALSGGQRQRVALARALIHRPRLLLLDEPLGALDALTRIEMQQLIESLWRQHRFTAVLVTHDVSEAVALADRVLLMEERRVTLDQAVDLPRPREKGLPDLVQLEAGLLCRVLQSPLRQSLVPSPPTSLR